MIRLTNFFCVWLFIKNIFSDINRYFIENNFEYWKDISNFVCLLLISCLFCPIVFYVCWRNNCLINKYIYIYNVYQRSSYWILIKKKGKGYSLQNTTVARIVCRGLTTHIYLPKLCTKSSFLHALPDFPPCSE